jgi:hypothetical protein
MSSQASSPEAASVLRALLYYDIFAYPLSAAEVHAFLPLQRVSLWSTEALLRELAAASRIYECDGFYAIRPDVSTLLARRRKMERYAARHWRIARAMTQVIKRFPFVSAVFVTGTLSKNIAAPELDIDYFIVTQPNRLWIARTMLIAFKKAALFNSKKFFCLNYFVSEDALAIPDRNVFTAAEIVHVKALYNEDMLGRFRNVNAWITELLPNWTASVHPAVPCSRRPALLSAMLAWLLRAFDLDALDDALMARWQRIWQQRYPDLSAERRDTLFRVRKNVSKAHGPDFQTRILAAFEAGCAQHDLSPDARLLNLPSDARENAVDLDASGPFLVAERIDRQPALALH